MTIYLKCLITTASAMLLFNIPSDHEDINSVRPRHDVERLITLTEKDIRSLESKVDSALISKSDSLTINLIDNGAVKTQ